MRAAIDASAVIHLKDSNCAPLTYKEAFFLATIGGAKLIGMENKLGSFQVGKWFNAQILNPSVEGGPINVYGHETLQELFQKMFYLLDDRNIEKVFVKGRQVV